MVNTVIGGLVRAIGFALSVAVVCGCQEGPASTWADHPSLSAEQGREDLEALYVGLVRRHAAVYHFTPQPQFEAVVAEVRSRVADLGEEELYFEFARISALVGDGHTYVEIPADAPRLPITIGQFGAEYRIVSASPGFERLLGARLVRIAETPVEQAADRLRGIAANDEHAVLRDLRVAGFMTSGVLLRGAGLVPRATEARLHLVGEDGEAFSVDVPALPPETRGAQVSAAALTPLAHTRPEQSFWCESLKQQRTVYCNFRRYDDLAARVRYMVDMIEREQPAKLAIDMRENGGGDYTKGEEYLIGAVRRLDAINRPGRLFVLIGPKTFSAAMNNAAQFADQTEAILVGRPIGEKPDSYQEPREFRLPNSKLKVRYSTRFYRFSNGAENMIRPDQDIPTTWEDFRAGRDPALEWILAYGAS